MINVFGDEVELVEEEEDVKRAVPKLFDWLASINSTKEDLRPKDSELRGYDPFIINKGLMQSQSTVGFAQLMNRLPLIPKEQHYLFLRLGIPRNKSYAKWSKADKFDGIKDVMAKLGYSEAKAKEAMLVLGKDGIKQLLTQKGGIQKKVRKKR